MQPNLIPNPDFQNGLENWEGTPVGVTLVASGSKRFVTLTGTDTSAAICSDPFAVIPGARYFVEVERPLKGDLELQVLSADHAVKLAIGDEFIPRNSPVRLQLTAKKGGKAAISRVSVVPVGERLLLTGVRSDVYFTPEGKPFRILASVTNVGSEQVIGATATLTALHHSLVEEHKGTQRIPALQIGESHNLEWAIKGQSRALAEYLISIEYGGREIRSSGSTVRHRPSPPSVRSLRSVEGNKKWFTVASRSLRLTARETDADFGPAHLSDESGKSTFGVLHQFLRIVSLEGEILPMWSKVRRISGGKAELNGENSFVSWTIEVSPNLRENSIQIELILRPKRRLVNQMIEFGPLESATEELSIEWTESSQISFEVDAPTLSYSAFRSGPMNFSPGAVVRASAVLRKKIEGLVRATP